MNIFLLTRILKLKSYWRLLLLLNSLGYAYQDFDYKNIYIDFTTSMGGAVTNPKELKSFEYFKEIYEKNNLTKIGHHSSPKIPKIIHQIWIGPRPIPTTKIFRETWINLHPDWHYKLWTNEDLKTITLQNQDLFDHAQNWGEKADILRYEILYQFGGLYVDLDFECLKPFDILHQSYDFYCGIEPLDIPLNSVFANNAIIGCAPRHPTMKHCLDTLKNDKNLSNVLLRTGPIHLSKSLLSQLSSSPGINIVFPVSYFYPLGWKQRNFNRNQIDQIIKNSPESFAIHHWASTWVEPKIRIQMYNDQD